VHDPGPELTPDETRRLRRLVSRLYHATKALAAAAVALLAVAIWVVDWRPTATAVLALALAVAAVLAAFATYAASPSGRRAAAAARHVEDGEGSQ
jgi:hypothetical protein